MRLAEVRALLSCEVIAGDSSAEEREVAAAFAADLMSDVLARAAAHSLLITGLTSAQVVHTADVADLRAILFVCDKKPGPQVVGLATDLGLPLLSTRHTLYDACGILRAAGLGSGHR
jgi:hypothetical protein